MPDRPLRSLCWTDEPDTRRAVRAILRRCGFDVVAEVTSAADAFAAARRCEPNALVVDVADTGDLGVSAVRAVHEVVPECAVVVLSSFDKVKPAALQAGAYDVVGHSDLRVLERSLRRLAAEVT